MRLALAMIGILAEDDDADVLERRQVERAEPLAARREDALAHDGEQRHDARDGVLGPAGHDAELAGRREVGSSGGGGRHDLSYFTPAITQGYVDQAVHAALVNLEARPAPAGEMTVVLGNGWPGILLHEAVGHGLEGDFNRKGSSVFSGRIGQRVAAKGVTVLDDGTLPDRRGSLNVDDEGVASKRNVLIEDGILVGYLQDRLNARLMNMKPDEFIRIMDTWRDNFIKSAMASPPYDPKAKSHYADLDLDIKLGVKIGKVEQGKKGVVVHYELEGAAQKLECDRLIVSVGRVPNTDNLGAAEVEPDVAAGRGGHRRRPLSLPRSRGRRPRRRRRGSRRGRCWSRSGRSWGQGPSCQAVPRHPGPVD